MNRSKNVGTAAESAVVTYLRANGFRYAERRALAGALDKGDIMLGPVCVEVKAGKAAETASDNKVAVWLNETEVERRNAKADVGVLVMKRAGYGATRAGDWWAVMQLRALLPHLDDDSRGNTPVRMHLRTAVELLRRMGYGDPLEEAA